PGTDVAGPIADDDDRREAEAAAALDDLRHPVDLDDALLERELVGVDPCHVSSSRPEVETGFAGGIGERLDPPVVPEPGSIEDDALDTGGPGPLGDQAADDRRLFDLGLLGAAELLLDRRRRRERLARAVVDDLRVDVDVAAEHREARPRPGSLHAEADPVVALASCGAAAGDLRHRPSFNPLLLAADLAGLAGLAADLLPGIAHALALVGLRLARGPDAGGDLADELLVDPDHREAGRVLELEADPRRRVDLDRVAVAQVELELLADLRGAIAHAGDLESLAVAVGDADDHVVDERPGQPVELAMGLLLGRPADDDRAVLLADGHVGVELTAQGPLRARDREPPPLDRHVDGRGDGDGHAADPGHVAAYQTNARTSPPSSALRACAPVMMPWLVLTMTMPSPPSTRGMSVLRAYTRSPGLLMRLSPETTGAFPSTYLSVRCSSRPGPACSSWTSAMKPSSLRIRAISRFV